jgi:hypothetical protein
MINKLISVIAMCIPGLLFSNMSLAAIPESTIHPIMATENEAIVFPATIRLKMTNPPSGAVLWVKAPNSPSYKPIETIASNQKLASFEPQISGIYQFELHSNDSVVDKITVSSIPLPNITVKYDDKMYVDGKYSFLLQSDCQECSTEISLRSSDKVINSVNDQNQLEFQPKSQGTYILSASIRARNPLNGAIVDNINQTYNRVIEVKKAPTEAAFINTPLHPIEGEPLPVSLIIPGLRDGKRCEIVVLGKKFNGCDVVIETEDTNGLSQMDIEGRIYSDDAYHIPAKATVTFDTRVNETEVFDVKYLGGGRHLVSTLNGNKLKVSSTDKSSTITQFLTSAIVHRNIFADYEFTSLHNNNVIGIYTLVGNSSTQISAKLKFSHSEAEIIAPTKLDVDIVIDGIAQDGIEGVMLYMNGYPIIASNRRLTIPITKPGEVSFKLELTTKTGYTLTDEKTLHIEGNQLPTCEIQTNIEDKYYNARCNDLDGFVMSVEWKSKGKTISSRRKLDIPEKGFPNLSDIRLVATDNLGQSSYYMYSGESQMWVEVEK